MKRRASQERSRKGKREPTFPFLALFPELRDLVIQACPIASLASLSSTCKQMRNEVSPWFKGDALLPTWRALWNEVYGMYTPYRFSPSGGPLVSNMRRMLRALVEFKMDKWPGITYCAETKLFATGGNDETALHMNKDMILFTWYDHHTDDAEVHIEYASLMYSLKTNIWRISFPPWLVVNATSLKELCISSQAGFEVLKRFIAKPTRSQYHFPLGL